MPYYEDIDRVDLNKPFSPDEQNLMLFYDSAPSGILEYREGRFACVRGSDAFLLLLQELDLLAASRMGTGRQALADPPPRALLDAAGRGSETDGWIDMAPLDQAQAVAIRMRRVSRNPATGCVAFLAVLLPVNQQMREELVP